MIEGVPIDHIDAHDCYRRFVVLRMLLKKAMAAALLEETQQCRRYVQLQRELDGLQELVSTKNSKGQVRAGETVLRIEELHSQLAHMVPKVREKKDAFEGDLLKRWRGALAAKKKKEEQTKRQKDAKSTSNKNLMYLTSELLKKERVSTHNLITHKEKVEEIQGSIGKMLEEADEEFRVKFDDMRKLMKEQKDKVDQMMEQYRQSLTVRQQQFKAESKQVLVRLQQRLKEEHQRFLANSKGIKQIITMLAARQS